MRRLATAVFATGAALLLAASELEAQRVAVEFRTTAAAATQKLVGSDLDTGLGIGGAVVVPLRPHLSAYAGLDWMRFHTPQSFAGADVNFVETGYALGLRFENAFAHFSDFIYRIEAGGTYKHVEVENADGGLVADSGYEPGFELAGGLLIPLGDSWRLAPSLRYRSLQPVFEVEGVATEGALRYGALDFGVSYRF